MPLIAKPRYGSGSKGVQVFYDLPAITHHIKQYQTNGLGELLIEEFIVGREFGIDAIVQNGIITFINIRSKLMTDLPFRQELRYISPAKLSETEEQIITNYLNEIIATLQIKNSLFNADMILDNSNIPHLIEISPRPAGLAISSRLIRYTTDRDLISDFIKYQLGDIKSCENIWHEKYALLQFIDIKNCTIKTDINISELVKKYRLKYLQINFKKGDKLADIIDGSDLTKRGFYIIADTNYDLLLKRNEEILNIIKRSVENGK